MADIIIEPVNHVYAKVYADESILKEIHHHFTVEDEKMKFHPLVKKRVWDGKIRLFKLNTQLLYKGLVPKLIDYANNNGYTVENNVPSVEVDIPDEQIESFVSRLNLSTGGARIEPYGFQLEAFKLAVKKKQAVILSPTASGKSLIIYLTTRYFLKDIRKPILIIVPNKQLVSQLYGDFVDYSTFDERFDEKMIACIIGGKEKCNAHPIVISTWQSIYKLPASWYSNFGGVIIDEAHSGKSESIKAILEKNMPNCVCRIGLTGTLSNEGAVSDPLLVQGLLGVPTRVASAKELMGSVLASLKLKAFILEHPQSSRKAVYKMSYPEEREWICNNEQRNMLIVGLAKKLTGNTLILTELVEKHAQPLYELMKEHIKEKPVHIITGDVKVEDREEIRIGVDKHERVNAVIVATYGCLGVGVSIKNLDNIIFATASKGYIRVMQSIGRGLRTSGSKSICRVYDLIDNLQIEAKTYGTPQANHSWNHGCSRLSIYAAEEYPHEIVKITMPEVIEQE